MEQRKCGVRGFGQKLDIGERGNKTRNKVLTNQDFTEKIGVAVAVTSDSKNERN